MSLYYEWIDFVTFPRDPNRIMTKEARLECSNAIRIAKESLSSVEEINKQVELIAKFGGVVTKDQIVTEDDEFEVMEITDYGKVAIWTKKRVWTLLRQGDMERLTFLPRHPQFSQIEK
jgi:hypothetical protein